MDVFYLDADAHYNFGLMLMQIHDDDAGAELMYRHCVAVNPSHVSALYNLANLLYTIRGSFLEAEIMYRRAIDLDNTHLAAICNYGTLLKVNDRSLPLPIILTHPTPHLTHTSYTPIASARAPPLSCLLCCSKK